jgi:hypothetical protein
LLEGLFVFEARRQSWKCQKTMVAETHEKYKSLGTGGSMITGGKRWRRYEISTIAPAYRWFRFRATGYRDKAQETNMADNSRATAPITRRLQPSELRLTRFDICDALQ